MIDENSKIFVAGSGGLVGRAIVDILKEGGFKNLVLSRSADLDLRNKDEVRDFFELERPVAVINAAARVGGILANSLKPYDFIMDNLQIQSNLIDVSVKNGIEKFIFLGSSCIYPKFSNIPIKESELLTGALEPTNEWYSVAKIAGIKACQAVRRQFGKDYISLMPTNLYGYYDNFNLESSHVLPAMIRKFHEAKLNESSEVVLWGSGTPMREFLFAEDLARAVKFALVNDLQQELYNIGSGSELSIEELAHKVRDVVGFKGEISWDRTKPDGTPRKLLDSTSFKDLGWKHEIDIDEGLRRTYRWYLENHNTIRD